MEIRVKRTVSIYPQYKDKFFELVLKGVDQAKSTMGVEPLAFVNLTEEPNRIDVNIYTDFKSMAHYEEVFLHKALFTDGFLDDVASGVEMIHDNPRDEMFVRLKTDDYFMNRKGEFNFADMSALRSDEKTKYRVDRLLCVAPGRLKEAMAVYFGFNQDYAEKFGRLPDFFCTRFASNRIGGVSPEVDVNNLHGLRELFAEHDRIIAEKHPGLLMQPTVDSYLRRITDDIIGKKVIDSEFSRTILRRVA